jgi:RNA polymerase-binding transcription factor DksA
MDTNKYQQQLEKERDRLIAELEKIAFRDDENPNDWVPRREDQNISDNEAVENFELAEEIEEYEKNTATVKELEGRLNEVKAALKRISDGKFGIDEVSGEPISPERLEANPAARSSVANAPQLERKPKTENEID